MELEHKALWAVKTLNFDLKTAGEKRLLDLNELEELRLHAYENSRTYKEKTKIWHDKRMTKREFAVGDKVLVFNTRLKLFPGKLKSRWIGPYTITRIFSHGALEVSNGSTTFKVNGHRAKIYIVGEPFNFKEVMLLTTDG